MGSRRKGREAALQMLFQLDGTGLEAEDVIAGFWNHLSETREGEEFATSIVSGYWNTQADVDKTISDVSHHWRIERMTKVDRNILRLSAYELNNFEDIPRRVTLNEAVELAKRFGTEASPGFVNGILDRIAADLGKS